MANPHDDPIAQANDAIHDLFRQAPNGCIPAEDRSEYERLLGVWLAAVQHQDEDEEPARVAA